MKLESRYWNSVEIGPCTPANYRIQPSTSWNSAEFQASYQLGKIYEYCVDTGVYARKLEVLDVY
jgi:hypothetical protein